MKKKLLNIAMSVIVAVALFGMIAPSTAQPEFPYTVFGYVYDTDGVTPAVDGVTVTVTNLNTSASLSDTTKYGLGYYVTEFQGGVAIGNQLQINATFSACLASITTITATGHPQIVNVTLQADDTAPTISDLMPADGACVTDSTPEICADYNDGSGSGIDVATVTITVDGGDVTGAATVTGGGVCYTPSSDLSEGAHTVIVNVSDLCGNPSTKSWTFTVDTIAPTIVFIEPPTPANNSETTLDYVNVSVNVTDAGCGVDAATVMLVWNGTAYPMVDIGSTYFLEMTDLSTGSYTYWVEANDTGNNVGVSESRVVTVNVTYSFTIEFVTGYNMITMPLDDPSVLTASSLMTKIGGNCREVLKWNATTQAWQTYNSFMPPQAAFDIEGGEGYFVNMTGSASVEFSGQGWESPFAISLVTDYNLIGIPVDDPSVLTASSLVTKIGLAYYPVIYKWDPTTGWTSYNQFMPPQAAFDIEGGEGYLVQMTGATDVTFAGAPWQD